MRRNFKNISQHAAYLQLQKFICLLLLLKYAKSLQESFGANGARLVDADGNVLNIPQGALTGSTPVETKTIAASSAITGIVGSDFTLIRAVSINLGGKLLSSSAELSIPAPQGINTALPIVIARAIEVKGATKLKLVSLAKVSGSLITSVFPVSPVVQGIKLSGTYYFLQAKSSLGFVCPISVPLGQLNGIKILDDVCEV